MDNCDRPRGPLHPPLVPIAAEGEQVDLHKPKPVHGWRDFLNEIGTIVIGVLIALAGEQAVASLHHRSQAAELGEALDQELSYDLGVLKDTVDLAPCLDRRLAEIARWSEAAASQHPIRNVGAFGRPPGQILHTANWRAASGGSVDILPLGKRISYAHFYDGFGNVDRIRDEARAKWGDIMDLEGADALTKREALRIAHDIRDVRAASALLASNYDAVRDQIATQLHVAPSKGAVSSATRDFLAKQRATFCRSISADARSPGAAVSGVPSGA